MIQPRFGFVRYAQPASTKRACPLHSVNWIGLAINAALAVAFLTTTFFVATGFGFDIAAFFSAHRFFKAATIAARPALLSLRLGGCGLAGDAGGPASPHTWLRVPSVSADIKHPQYCRF